MFEKETIPTLYKIIQKTPGRGNTQNPFLSSQYYSNIKTGQKYHKKTTEYVT